MGRAPSRRTFLGLLAGGAAAAQRVRFYQHRPAEELYDLRTDPHELHNQAPGPAQRPLVADLRQQLEAWMKQQNDPLLDRLD